MPNLQHQSASGPYQQALDTSWLPTSNPMLQQRHSPYDALARRLVTRHARPSPVSIADIFVSSLIMASFCADHSPRTRKLPGDSMNTLKVNARGFKSAHMIDNRAQFQKKRLDCFHSPIIYLGARDVRTDAIRNGGYRQVSEVDASGGARSELYVRFPSGNRKNQTSEWGDSQNIEPEQQPRGTQGHMRKEPCTGHPLLNLKRAPKLEERKDPAEQARLPPLQEPDPRSAEATLNPRTKDSRTCTAVIKYISPPTAVTSTSLFSSDRREGLKKPAEHDTQLQPLSRQARQDLVKGFASVLEDPSKSNQYVFRLYRLLPSPGVALLGRRLCKRLLLRFSNPVNKSRVDARRYIDLVNDMIKANLPLTRTSWTSAIHLAGRGGKKKDLMRAIGLWQQMEDEARIQSDSVVFNILIECAVKAGQFVVVDRLVDEMASRGIRLNRNGYVTRIFYYGKLGDIDRIRQAYSELVESGHLIDTVILNCLIASFARASDAKTVTELYDRMMEAHNALQQATYPQRYASRFLPSLSSEMCIYRKRNKELRSRFEALASLKKEMPERHRAIQQSLPLSPDTRTFYVLLSFHARRTGNLKQFMSVVGDMETVYTVPPRGMIYLLLFEGFASHGGQEGQWTAEKLRYAWETYLRALSESMARFNDRFHGKTQRPVWENPLNRSSRKVKNIQTPKQPVGLYVPLPKNNPDVSNSPNGGQLKYGCDEESKTPSKEEAPDCSYDLDHIDVDELFNNPKHTREAWDEMAELDRQIENGVFLGRQMITLILRAFGACCTPEEVVDVWLLVQRLWNPDKRRATDVEIIKKELDMQLRKAASRLNRQQKYPV